VISNSAVPPDQHGSRQREPGGWVAGLRASSRSPEPSLAAAELARQPGPAHGVVHRADAADATGPADATRPAAAGLGSVLPTSGATEDSPAGPLGPLLQLPGVTDVLVNAPHEVWLDRGFGLERAAIRFPDDGAVRRLGQRLAATVGRRLDDGSPFLDAALPDGVRLHAVLPPLAPATMLSLRVLGRHRWALASLVSPPVADLLAAVVSARLAFLISGGTGTGKTTLLGALLGVLPPSERVVLIEDARELVTPHPHLIRLVTRVANIEGAGAVGLRELVRQALRMRPDRLVVGEFRGAETVDLLIALNTGHEGAAATVHANAAAQVPARLIALGHLGGLPAAVTTELLRSAVDVLVHLRRSSVGERHVAEVAVLHEAGRELRVAPAWSSAKGSMAAADALVGLLAARGVPAPAVLR
jgi:pilus assembly protein CpaF